MKRAVFKFEISFLMFALSGCKASESPALACSGEDRAQIVFYDDSNSLTADGDYEFKLAEDGETATCEGKIEQGEASVSACSSSSYSLFTITGSKTVGDAVTQGDASEIGGIDFSEFGTKAPDLKVLRNGKVIFEATGPKWASTPQRDCVAHSWYAAVPNVDGGGGAGGANPP